MQQKDDARHELRNLLGVALANVEAMIDGLVPPTTLRLEALAEALQRAGALVDRDDREA